MQKQKRQIVDVPLGDIEKNPFRHFETYGLQAWKIDELKESMKETGVWENIVGRRRKDGKVEIAYGHHRVAAAKALRLKTIPIIIKDLSDDRMRKMMIRENREQWRCVPAAIDDAVQAARDFLESNRDEAKKTLSKVRPGFKRVRVGPPAIAKYTGFSETAVDLSLHRLGMIERKEVDRDALYKMPHQEAAKRFAQKILERSRFEKIPPAQQRKLADRIVEVGRFGEQSIEQVFVEFVPLKVPDNREYPGYYELKLRKATTQGNKLICTLIDFGELQRQKTVIGVGVTTEDISEPAKNGYMLMLGHLAKAIEVAGKRLDEEPAKPLFEEMTTPETSRL